MYKGCTEPLTVHNISDGIFSGDGLGGVAHEYEPCTESLKSGHAVDKLVELVNDNPGISFKNVSKSMTNT